MSKLVVVGSGVVGRATGKGFSLNNHEVVFCDINLETLRSLRQKGFKACTPEELIREEGVDAYFLSVSTPTVDEKIHLNFLEVATSCLGGILKKYNHYSLVVVRSTVPPGTTEDMVIPLLQNYSAKRAGTEFGVAMNPEYLREKSSEQDFRNPRILVIGEFDKKSGDTLEGIYFPLGKPSCDVLRTSIREAEIQKYLHNYYNALKISFGNEARNLCKTLGINADKVLDLVMTSAEASWNRSYGIRDFGAFSGSCLPKDTTALLSWAKALDIPMHLLKGTILVNEMIKRNYENDPE